MPVTYTILSNKSSAVAISKNLVSLLTFKFCCPPFSLQLIFLWKVLILWQCTENISEGNMKKMLTLSKEAFLSQSEAFRSEKRDGDWFNDFSSSWKLCVSVTYRAFEISWFLQRFCKEIHTVFLRSIMRFNPFSVLKLNIICVIIFKTCEGYRKSLSNFRNL